MTYAKPELVAMTPAVKAIQGQPKPMHDELDSADELRLTNAAYEADE